MAVGTTHVSTTAPDPPSDADFAIYIDFVKGEGNAARVFQAADAMIRALQKLDHALCASIDTHIEPVLVLEEIQTGSIKIWLRDALKSADDQALKSLDWKPAVGKYLVRAKYVYIEWANKDGKDGSLINLARQLSTIASETDVKHLPDYAPPSVKDLADATKDIQSAKAYLLPGDRITYLPSPKSGTGLAPLDFDLSVSWAPEELLSVTTKETTKFENMPMNLIVRRPDYLGTAMWEFRHGKQTIAAKIMDGPWLQRFQNRAIDVRPGDALKCLVTIERNYGYDNELLDEKFIISVVEDVLQNQMRQLELPS